MTTTPALFTPFTLKGVTFRNRVAVSPMCQYMAKGDGFPTQEWHAPHLIERARSGAGLVVIEATAVSPEGRITPGCTGLWSDAHAAAFAPIVKGIKEAGAVAGIQLAHAGRKASANVPWEGDDHIPESDPRAWEIIAPSAVPYGGGLSRTPREMTKAEIERVKADFVASAKRAQEGGFEFLLLHLAHGYLAQSFNSAIANQRKDEYGADRGLFAVELVQAVRKVWPAHLPLAARVGVVEFDGRPLEEELAESIAFVNRLKEAGLDFLDVSMGFNSPTSAIPWGPAMLKDIAARVLKATGLPGSTSWNIATPQIAESYIADNAVDLVMIGRPFLANPFWTFEAARALGLTNPTSLLPPPYAHWLARYKF